jgi:hypothetical protein
MRAGTGRRDPECVFIQLAHDGFRIKKKFSLCVRSSPADQRRTAVGRIRAGVGLFRAWTRGRGCPGCVMRPSHLGPLAEIARELADGDVCAPIRYWLAALLCCAR